MSTEYIKTSWQDGDIITADKMNNIENGIKDVEDTTTSLKEDFDDIDDRVTALEGGGSGSGLTEEIKQAMLQIARKVTYVDEHGQDYYDDLYDALYAVTAIRLDANSIMLTSIGSTQQLTATTTPAGGTVTWASSDTSIATVSNTGLVTSVGYGSCTITASSGSVSATCAVAVSQVSLTSIAANYQQSGTVYDTASLDSLKSDLTVTATYSDSSTATVTEYTLSGTLTVGTSTITVSYGGKDAEFNVTVSSTSAYVLTNRVFDGVDDYEDTGIQLLLNDTAFTIFVDFTADAYASDSALLHCVTESGRYPGFFLGERTNSSQQYFRHSYYSSSTPTYFHLFDNNRHKYLIVHNAGDENLAAWYFDNTEKHTSFGSRVPYVSVPQNLLIGCYQDSNGDKGRFWSGTIHTCRVWNEALSDEKISELMGGE